MSIALNEARLAAESGEVPVGAVIECGGEVIAVSGNEREERRDPTAHAEIVAIRLAAENLGSWRLSGCTIYVTIEPCAMCAGAIYQARIEHLVYGAADEKAGAAGSLMNIVQDSRLNHQLKVTTGVLANESSALLRQFFSDRR